MALCFADDFHSRRSPPPLPPVSFLLPPIVVDILLGTALGPFERNPFFLDLEP